MGSLTMTQLGRAAIVIAAGILCASCRSGSDGLPPVFGAVFGLDGAESIPFRTGTIPKRDARPNDRVIGDAANLPGQCIYLTPGNMRFRAPCPKGYAIGASG